MTHPSTLNEILRLRASQQPARLAYTYLAEGDEGRASLTYAELECRARSIGAALQGLKAQNERALLLYPAGLDFIAAFFGCLYSGVIAIPAYPPHPARPQLTLPRLRAIVADSQASVVLTTSKILSKIAPLFAEEAGLKQLLWLDTEKTGGALADEWREPELSGQSLAFLQYTSGSTSAPKGVMVSHQNLLHNSAYIRHGFEHTTESVGVTWLPSYHDMGLIDGIIQPLYAGFPCYLMSPAFFLQRPLRWLQAISDFRATHSGGPNFAYELCARKVKAEQRAGLDLSSWSVAYNGSEPVRQETLRRFTEAFAPCGFRSTAFYPAYGLAEATLKVAGGRKDALPVTCTVQSAALEQNMALEVANDEANVKTLVGSGEVSLGTKVVIVEPSSLTQCVAGQVGEVWVSGPGVAQGYWNRPELSEQTFQAYLADTDEGPFLRTGDTGFYKDGELFITGRLKDLIIIGGRNHYPQDIELLVEQSHTALRSGAVAAFSIEVEGEEQLVIAAEIDHRYRTIADEAEPSSQAASQPRPSLDLKALTRAVRCAVADHYGIQVHALALLKIGTIPKTSSGKIRRHACRNNFLTNSLERLMAT
jgi:acyl-CoA synthetase (AMP-forming)/AMP-acid ligase II